jgi:dCMP deaminase
MNGIFNAALNGIKLNYSHCYLTISPCENCAKALIQVGVERVVYSEEYVKDAGLLWLNEARIEATQFLIKNPWWDKNEEIEIIA